jgi:competence protein ComEC
MKQISEINLNPIHDFFISERHRMQNFIPVGIGMGICIYFSLNNEPSLYANIAVFLAASLLSMFVCNFTAFNESLVGHITKFTVAAFLAISFGFFISQIRTNCINTFMLNWKMKIPVFFSATLESCEKTEKGTKFIVSNIRRKKTGKMAALCKKFNKLHLTWNGEKSRNTKKNYLPGDKVLFKALLSPIAPQSFPGAYDFKKQQYFKGVSARGFIIAEPKILGSTSTSSMKTFIEYVRHRINKKIEHYLKKDTAAVAKALITGNTSGISKKIRSSFSNSGIAHILAISGLHMGIIGFFVFWVMRIILCPIYKISMFYDIKKIAAVISWMVTLFYLYLSGCSVSSIRAFIMHTIIILAILMNRTALTMRSVAIAATCIMLFTPEVILFPSFQLSFGAVIGIVSFYEFGFKFPKFMRGLTEIVATTVIASIPTSIISVAIFNQLTLNSILANIICIPLMSFFIMPVAVIALFMMAFNLSSPFISLMGYGVDFLILIADKTSKLPGSFFVMHTPTNAIYCIIILSGLFFALIHHKIRYIGLIGTAAGIVCYFFQPLPDVFVSKNAKVIGIRTDNCVCFNHLGYFRSISNSWAKSLGIEKSYNFKSNMCKKCVQKIDSDTYIANIKNKKIVITSDDEYEKDGDEQEVFHLNGEKNRYAELIYLDKKIKTSNKYTHRPWS